MVLTDDSHVSLWALAGNTCVVYSYWPTYWPCSRKHLRILTGLLTGHVALNRHLMVMNIHTDPMCPKCGEDEETAYHFFSKCDAIMMVRYSIFGSYLMEVSELQQVKLHTLLKFVRASKRFI